MNVLQVYLFGKFSLVAADQPRNWVEGNKSQQLFCYLLLHPNRPHPRELLGAMLWDEQGTAQSKKYLRKALWQLQTALEINGVEHGRYLQTENDWIQLLKNDGLWVDTHQFEEIYTAVRGLSGESLSQVQVRLCEEAVQLYRADLLEGCYEDWCLFERERLHQLYLNLLDKLMRYCETHQLYDNGLNYGAQILRFDSAHEQTHRRLMRLRYAQGDRTGALRQYLHCAEVLAQELGVAPAQRTQQLYQQIRDGTAVAEAHYYLSPPQPSPTLHKVLHHLHHLNHTLAAMQQQVAQEIEAVNSVLET